MSVHFRDQVQVVQARDLCVERPVAGLPDDIAKSSMAMFISEVLHRSLPDGYVNEGLYDYLIAEIGLLSDYPASYTTPLYFMLRLTHYYGFYPADDGQGTWFSLKDGTFQDRVPVSDAAMDQAGSALLRRLMAADEDHSRSAVFSLDERRYLMHKLLEYLKLHVEGMGRIKSLEVLEAVFGD